MRVSNLFSKAAASCLSLALLAGACAAQEPAAQEPSESKEAVSKPSAEPKSYEKVITSEATTKRGVFTVHQVKQRWYYEIPASEMNKEFLWVVQFAGVPAGTDRGNRPRARVVRWERHGNKLYLREVRYEMVADPSTEISRGVAASNSGAIHAAYNVEAWGPNESAVIDVTNVFTSDMKELGPTNIGKVDTARSFVQRIVTFPENVEVEAAVTTTDTVNTIPTAPGQPPGKSTVSATYLVHTSMVKLPEKPMMPRLFDDRVGYFTVRTTDFGSQEHKAARRQFIARWRLEKKDPTATLSEPVRPITYYVDPATPKKWVPYIKQAVEKWQVAFEEAGFKNAIVAKDAPTPEQDPDWSTEDVRNTVIRWLPSTTANARGPHIADPRSGEILNGGIVVYHNVLDLIRSMYFVQVSPIDPRAQKLPLPDDLMGKLLEYVITHEVGHTLGLRHNMKASSTYPAEKMRDPEWVRSMGHTPSLMDYSRFNYVAQPEDNFDPATLVPGIGPYDKWAIAWGYKPIVGAGTPEVEKPALDQWAREQDTTPHLRYADDAAADKGYDPGEQAEAVGDADAVASTSLGLKNLERVAGLLVSATSTQPGEPYDDLKALNKRLLSQWSQEMGHVVRIVGGVAVTNKHVGQEGTIFSPIPAEKQREAVKFLNEKAFAPPLFLLNPEVVNRIDPNAVPQQVADAQEKLLKSLLAPERIDRLQNLQTLNPKEGYVVTDFLADVRAGLWKELRASGKVRIEPLRRNIQRAYVGHLATQIHSSKAADVRPFLRGELAALRAQVRSVMPRAGDPATRAHLDDVQDQITRILDPRVSAVPAANPKKSEDAMAAGDPSEFLGHTNCWPELD